MILRDVPFLTPEQRAGLKPEVGETVLFEGARFVVTKVGLKYVFMHPEGNPRGECMAKIQFVSKIIPETPEEPLGIEFDENNFDSSQFQ